MDIQSRAIVGVVLALFAVGAFGQNPVDCGSVKFSAEVLSQFPRARDACLDVISRGGQEYAVFNARLSRVRGNTMRVRFHQPDGSLGASSSISVPRDFRVLINGVPTRVSDIAQNQDLKAYVQVTRPMLALEPADSRQELLVVPLAVEAEPLPSGAEAEQSNSSPLAQASDEPVMPNTAGPAPILATFGLVFACAALGMRALRGMRSLRRRRIESITTS